jgi:hypothetical protein
MACRMFIAMVLLVISGISWPSAAAVADGPKLLAKQKNSPQIGSIKQKVEGSGCYFHFPDQDSGIIFYSEGELPLVNGEPPIINIDGQDIQLKLVQHRTVGQRTAETYTSGNITVTMDILQLKEFRASTSYKAVMTVQRGSSKTVVQLLGSCGC